MDRRGRPERGPRPRDRVPRRVDEASAKGDPKPTGGSRASLKAVTRVRFAALSSSSPRLYRLAYNGEALPFDLFDLAPARRSDRRRLLACWRAGLPGRAALGSCRLVP